MSYRTVVHMRRWCCGICSLNRTFQEMILGAQLVHHCHVRLHDNLELLHWVGQAGFQDPTKNVIDRLQQRCHKVCVASATLGSKLAKPWNYLHTHPYKNKNKTFCKWTNLNIARIHMFPDETAHVSACYFCQHWHDWSCRIASAIHTRGAVRNISPSQPCCNHILQPKNTKHNKNKLHIVAASASVALVHQRRPARTTRVLQIKSDYWLNLRRHCDHVPNTRNDQRTRLKTNIPWSTHPACLCPTLAASHNTLQKNTVLFSRCNCQKLPKICLC